MPRVYERHEDAYRLEREFEELWRKIDETDKAVKKARERDRGLAGAAAAAPLPFTRGWIELTFVAAGEPVVVQ